MNQLCTQLNKLHKVNKLNKLYVDDVLHNYGLNELTNIRPIGSRLDDLKYIVLKNNKDLVIKAVKK